MLEGLSTAVSSLFGFYGLAYVALFYVIIYLFGAGTFLLLHDLFLKDPEPVNSKEPTNIRWLKHRAQAINQKFQSAMETRFQQLPADDDEDDEDSAPHKED